jgi:hypothetical protein
MLVSPKSIWQCPCPVKHTTNDEVPLCKLMISCDWNVRDFELPVKLWHFATLRLDDGTLHEACSSIDIPFLDNGANL